MTRQRSLLIVDDCEPNRDALSRRLARQGYVVATAEDGEQALALVACGGYDLILLDVEMPGMTGLDVLRRLRETHSQTVLPVIMVTARSQGADIVDAFRAGANDYVTKPIDFPVALARIGTHLSHKQAVEDLREARSVTRSLYEAPTTDSGTGISARTRPTGLPVGRRCSGTRNQRSAPVPMNG